MPVIASRISPQSEAFKATPPSPGAGEKFRSFERAVIAHRRSRPKVRKAGPTLPGARGSAFDQARRFWAVHACGLRHA